MPGTSPPGEAEGKGPSAYIGKQDTTTQHVTTGAGLPPVNHMSAARRDAKSCVAHGGRDPKGLPHGAGQTAGERNGHDPDARLPGSPQAKAKLRAQLAAQIAALDEDLETRQAEAASNERRQVTDAAADDVDGGADEDQVQGEGRPATGHG